MQFFTTLAVLVAAVRAIQVTSPAMNTVWTAGTDQTITWTSVDTDTSTISVYLVNFSHYPTQTILLKSGVATSEGTLTISGSYLSAGTGYQINMVPGTNTEQILAQSNQFSIVAAAGASTPAAATSGSATAAAAGTSSTSSSTALPRSNSTLATSSTSMASVSSVSGTGLFMALGSLFLL